MCCRRRSVANACPRRRCAWCRKGVCTPTRSCTSHTPSASSSDFLTLPIAVFGQVFSVLTTANAPFHKVFHAHTMAKRFFAKVVSQDTVQGVFEKLGSKMDYKAGFSAAAATVASTAAVVMYKSGSLREVVKSLRQTLRKTYKSSTTTAEKTSECLTARWTRFCFISLAFNNHQRYVKLKSDVAAACQRMWYLTIRLGFCCLQSEASGVAQGNPPVYCDQRADGCSD